MARGRMIVNAIASDARINNLSDDTSRLAFTWLVTFADCEGRTYGDPALVRSMLFPRRDDVTAEQMEGYIREWAACGLVIWYEAKGDKWIFFPGFEKNQLGLRRDRETPSIIPAPPRSNSGVTPELVRSGSGVAPAEIKLREEKRSEWKEGAAAAAAAPRFEPEVAAVVERWEGVVGREATPEDCVKLREWLEEYGAEKVSYAIGQAHVYGAPKLAYVWRVLSDGGYSRSAPGPPRTVARRETTLDRSKRVLDAIIAGGSNGDGRNGGEGAAPVGGELAGSRGDARNGKALPTGPGRGAR